MAQSPSDSSPDEMLLGDLETAKLFSQRVAKITIKFKGLLGLNSSRNNTRYNLQLLNRSGFFSSAKMKLVWHLTGLITDDD